MNVVIKKPSAALKRIIKEFKVKGPIEAVLDTEGVTFSPAPGVSYRMKTTFIAEDWPGYFLPGQVTIEVAPEKAEKPIFARSEGLPWRAGDWFCDGHVAVLGRDPWDEGFSDRPDRMNVIDKALAARKEPVTGAKLFVPQWKQGRGGGYKVYRFSSRSACGVFFQSQVDKLIRHMKPSHLAVSVGAKTDMLYFMRGDEIVAVVCAKSSFDECNYDDAPITKTLAKVIAAGRASADAQAEAEAKAPARVEPAPAPSANQVKRFTSSRRVSGIRRQTPHNRAQAPRIRLAPVSTTNVVAWPWRARKWPCLTTRRRSGSTTAFAARPKDSGPPWIAGLEWLPKARIKAPFNPNREAGFRVEPEAVLRTREMNNLGVITLGRGPPLFHHTYYIHNTTL